MCMTALCTVQTHMDIPRKLLKGKKENELRMEWIIDEQLVIEHDLRTSNHRRRGHMFQREHPYPLYCYLGCWSFSSCKTNNTMVVLSCQQCCVFFYLTSLRRDTQN